MNEKKKWPYIDALRRAVHWETLLRPYCERWQIVGSLRRKRSFVGDIEILYIPRFYDDQVDFFSTQKVDATEMFFESCLRAKILEKRPNVNGGFAWGAKNKLAIDVESGIPIDFFSTTEENWWVSLVIRTGSKATNLKLTMSANKQGMTLNAYGSGTTMKNGVVIPATSEEHVFKLCGVPYLEPEKR